MAHLRDQAVQPALIPLAGRPVATAGSALRTPESAHRSPSRSVTPSGREAHGFGRELLGPPGRLRRRALRGDDFQCGEVAHRRLLARVGRLFISRDLTSRTGHRPFNVSSQRTVVLQGVVSMIAMTIGQEIAFSPDAGWPSSKTRTARLVDTRSVGASGVELEPCRSADRPARWGCRGDKESLRLCVSLRARSVAPAGISSTLHEPGPPPPGRLAHRLRRRRAGAYAHPRPP